MLIPSSALLNTHHLVTPSPHPLNLFVYHLCIHTSTPNSVKRMVFTISKTHLHVLKWARYTHDNKNNSSFPNLRVQLFRVPSNIFFNFFFFSIHFLSLSLFSALIFFFLTIVVSRVGSPFSFGQGYFPLPREILYHISDLVISIPSKVLP